MAGKEEPEYRVMGGSCPDETCRTKLYFPAHDSSIECTGCGQRHPTNALKDITEANTTHDITKYLCDLLLKFRKATKGPESVKVLGRSNYECKILSPFLTTYGMDNKTGKAKLLSEMGRGKMFDFAALSDRAFSIDPDQMEVSGYGRDHTGSMSYLRETLNAINCKEECILPIHADGDGHCLVHAVSRAIIGRELFWHPLRANLKSHILLQKTRYMDMFGNYIDRDEWLDIIKECDPDYVLSTKDTMGLRNIHIFGLANVLRRPIVLLDSIEGIMKSGDYTGIFLPGLRQPEECRDKQGQPNRPLCLAWSSNGHNHYIAMVGVKGRPTPRLPNWMIERCGVWGMPQHRLLDYMNLEEDGSVLIGGTKSTGDQYLLRLMKAMEEVFLEQHGVACPLVADLHQDVLKSAGIVGFSPEVVIQETAVAVKERRLFRCLQCRALAMMNLPSDGFYPGGHLYKMAINCHGHLHPSKRYSFPTEGVICTYNEKTDRLVPERLSSCAFCEGAQLRLVRGDGSLHLMNGDNTDTPSTSSDNKSGHKVYWDGKEYDTNPKIFPVTLNWGGQTLTEDVAWFQTESDPALNSNAFDIANKLVQKHFPGEFGSEQLVQRVVEQILRYTASRVESSSTPSGEPENLHVTTDNIPTKIILTGHNRKTLHREELTKSETEKKIRQNVEIKAKQNQKRRTLEQTKNANDIPPSPSKVNPKLQKTGESKSNPVPTSSPIAHPSSPPVAPSPSNTKLVRVSTSDGRRSQLSIEGEVTFSELKNLLDKKLGVVVGRQRIKCGYPPRLLTEPADPAAPLALAARETLLLEILPDPDACESAFIVGKPTKDNGIPQNDEDFDNKLLRNIASLQNVSEMDNTDQTIMALSLTSTLLGAPLWTQAQTMPHLFSPSGAFYLQAKRDIGLTNKRHYRFPSLPEKIFRYNASDDLLELCMEAHGHGHYPVSAGMEDKVLSSTDRPPSTHPPANPSSTTPPAMSSQPRPATPPASPPPPFTTPFGLPTFDRAAEALKTGSSGVVVNPNIKFPLPFSGAGHTLADQTPATKEQPMDISPAGPPLPCSSETKQVDRFQRVGPGYRVVKPQAQNSTNETLDKFVTMAKNIAAAESQSSDMFGDEDLPLDQNPLFFQSDIILDKIIASLGGEEHMETEEEETSHQKLEKVNRRKTVVSSEKDPVEETKTLSPGKNIDSEEIHKS